MINTTQDLRSTTERELIRQLADSVELLLEMRPTTARPMAITQVRLIEARAYLDQPEPEGPTDGELFDVAESYVEDNCLLGLHNLPDFARVVLARWGTR